MEWDDGRKLMRRNAIALILTGLMAGQTLAADTGMPPLTWQDCVRLAAMKNPQLLSAIHAQEASLAQYNGSYNGIFPHLSLSNSYTDSKESGLGESKSWQAQGTASLDLIDLNQWATIQNSAASWRQSQANAWFASSNVLLSL